VGDVEESCRLAHREVLGDAALVLDRHVPAGEIHHPGTQLAVDMIQRSGERHGHAPLEAEGGKNAADHRGRIRADQGRSPRGPGGTRVPSDAMHIPSLLNGPRPTFSFEFYPPKTAAGEASLMSTLNELSELEPGFVSVTCGAAGTPQGDITELVARIQREHGLVSMAHLTCTGLTVDALSDRLERLAGAGIRNVLALRGDPPAGTSS